MPVTSVRDGSTLVITLDRPEKRNAIDHDMAMALDRELGVLATDDELRCGVLCATGSVFSAGTDLFDPRDKTTPDGGEYGLLRRRRDKPLIAAVEGAALGGGFEILLACDLVVASVHATFGLPETRRGVVATGGGLFRAQQVLPRNVVLELLLAGPPLEATRAPELGVVNRLVEPGAAVDAALELAAEIAEGGPVATALTLGVVRDFTAGQEYLGWALTAAAREKILDSPEAIEGRAAFAERRE